MEAPELEALLNKLAQVQPPERLAPLRKELTQHALRNGLQEKLESFLGDPSKPPAATWFVVDKRGNSVALALPDNTGRSTVGINFAWRSYFHGGPNDLDETIRTPLVQPLTSTQLSALFPSKATNVWKVAVSTPIMKDGELIGILALTVEMGSFMRFPSREGQFAVLVDGREGKTRGVILQHPLFEDVLAKHEKLPDRFASYRVALEEDWSEADAAYRDPLGADELGGDYRQAWIAALASVDLEDLQSPVVDDASHPTGLVVLVQESRDEAVAPVTGLGYRLVREGLAAVGVILVLVGCLWYFVIRSVSEKRFWQRGRRPPSDTSLTPLNEMETMLATGPPRKP